MLFVARTLVAFTHDTGLTDRHQRSHCKSIDIVPV